MYFRNVFREICGFVCSKFAGSGLDNYVETTSNETLCSPSPSAIVLYASKTSPVFDKVPSFSLSSLITVFWCIVLSLVYLASFPNRLTTTLGAAIQKNYAEALKKELSAAKKESESLSTKHQQALDDLNKKLEQTVEAHNAHKEQIIQDIAKEHAGSIKTLNNQHQIKIDEVKQACKKEIEGMGTHLDNERIDYMVKQSRIADELRSKIYEDDRQFKKEKAGLQKTIKEQEDLLEKADEETLLSDKEHARMKSKIDRARQNLKAQEQKSIALLAEKDCAISDLTQRLQRTEKKLEAAIIDVESQEFVDSKYWDELKEKVSTLERETSKAQRDAFGAKLEAQALIDEQYTFRDMYNAAKLEVETQAKANQASFVRATLKRARRSKSLLKRLQQSISRKIKGSLRGVKGQATAPKATNMEKGTVDTQVTAQTITKPRISYSSKSIQTKQTSYSSKSIQTKPTTSKSKVVEAELANCKEMAKAAQELAATELAAIRDSLEVAVSELNSLRTRLDQEQGVSLRARDELKKASLKLGICEQHGEEMQAQLETFHQALDDERAATNAATAKTSELSMALRLAHERLQESQDQAAAWQKQVAEQWIEPPPADHVTEEAMEVEHPTEETPMEWQDASIPIATDPDAMPVDVVDTITPMDIATTFSESHDRQSEDACMEDESQEEASSAEPIDTPMTAEPTASELETATPSTVAQSGLAHLPSLSSEAGLSLPVAPSSSQTLTEQIEDVFKDFDRSLFDSALFDDTPAPTDFDPAVVSLNEFEVAPQPQEVPSVLRFSPPPQLSVSDLQDSSPTWQTDVQATAPPLHASPPSPSEVSPRYNAPPADETSPLDPSPSDAAEPSLSAVQKGKQREDLETRGEEADNRPAATEQVEPTEEEVSEEVSEKEDSEEGVISESGPWTIDPNHDIFQPGYASTDSSPLSSPAASDFVDWDSDEYNPDATREAEETKAEEEAARLRKVDKELKARARRAGPGPSGRDTAISERRVIAPKSKKSKCKQASDLHLDIAEQV